MTTRRIKNNKKRTLLKFGFFLYLAVCLFSTIWLRATVVSLEYEIGELDRLRADLISERKTAVAERASFYSTAYIENTALKRLGMTLPERDNVFFVKRVASAGPFRASME